MPNKLIMAAALPALLLTAGAATAQENAPPSGPEASIPFVNHGGIYNFVSDRDGQGVYLQDRRRNWYYARFFARCNDLPFAFRVGFKTWGGSDTLDRGSTILTGRERCKIASLVKSGPPPKKAKKAKAAKS
jgi:hypothetical protein